ncbi:GbsR/MarR family transcriptional regulator [Pleionea sediminis]|uniref:GbsR/MarR family transcriptional regulator n=1 Tax=Pleionea sediminis TaxID=2569479 RepID=UPI0011859FBB|nr:MarR family transcriptional regulator [Pleionea sediminis]
MNIPPDIESFVVHFGEMGSRWGFNRTVGQMFALIVLTEEALNADQIADALGISRGNVSMGLKELQSWRLVRTQPQPGDRKDYFRPNGTVWELAMQVLSERRKREVDPTLSVLRSELMNSQDEQNSYSHQKMREIHDLLELFIGWFDDIHKMSPENLKTLLKLGSGVGKVLDMKDRLLTKN